MTRSTPCRLAVAAGVPAVLAAGLAVATPANAAQADYKGSSLAIKLQVGVAGSTLIDEILPGLVSFPSGGDSSVLELPAELSEVATLKVLNAASGVKSKVLSSNARTAQLTVLGGLVTAGVLNADCTAENLKLAGDSQVTDLAIAGTKVPIDPGPNFEIELPAALAPFVTGGIFIDEQQKLPSGDLQVRALHVRLVVDPAGAAAALKAVSETVRQAAEQVTAAVEQATGETIETLAQAQRTTRGAAGPPQPRPGRDTVEPEPAARAASNQAGGARAGDQQEVRAAVAQKAAQRAVQKTGQNAGHDKMVRAREAQAAAAEAQAGAAEARAAEAQVRADEAADEAAQVAAGTQSANALPKARKADRAAVPAQTVPVESAESERSRPEAGTPTQNGPSDGELEAARVHALAAQDAADAAAAEARDARRAADEAHAASYRSATEAASSTAPSTSSTASSTASTATTRAATDRAAVPVTAPDVAAAAAPVAAIAEGDLGVVGLDVVVSQVTCKGREIAQVRAKPPVKAPERPPAVPEALPRTGGDGNSTFGVGLAGLGLLVVGSGAVFAVRRRASRGV